MSALRVVKFSRPRPRRVRTDHLSLDETLRAAYALLLTDPDPRKLGSALCGLAAVLPERTALQRRVDYFIHEAWMRARTLHQNNIGKPMITIGGDDREGA